MKSLFSFIFISFFLVVEARASSLLPTRISKSFFARLDQMGKSNLNNLEVEIENLNKQVEYFIQSRQKECSGEFTSVEITTEGESDIFKRKLSSKETGLCLLEIIHFRKRYVNDIYKLRMISLKNSHKKQKEELNSLKSESLLNLDKLSKKIQGKFKP